MSQSKFKIFFQGIGVSFTRDAASMMLGQYFKRRREIVEIFLVSSPGVGVAVISRLFDYLLRFKIYLKFKLNLLAKDTFMFYWLIFTLKKGQRPKSRVKITIKKIKFPYCCVSFWTNCIILQTKKVTTTLG